jgi:hypothetical protein
MPLYKKYAFLVSDDLDIRFAQTVFERLLTGQCISGFAGYYRRELVDLLVKTKSLYSKPSVPGPSYFETW